MATEDGIFVTSCMNNSTTKHDTMKLIASLQSESTAHFNNINILYHGKLPKIGENPLRLGVSSKFSHFCNVLKTLDNSYE